MKYFPKTYFDHIINKKKVKILRKIVKYQKLLNFKRPSSNITSTDGLLTVPSVGRVAKKPGQR